MVDFDFFCKSFHNFAPKLEVNPSEITQTMSLSNDVKSVIFTILTLFIFSVSHANEGTTKHESKEEFNVSEMIMHHIKDAHEWHLWGPEHGGTAIYLPVILYDNGIKSFSSSLFYHGSIQTTIDKKTKEEANYIVGKGSAAGYALFHEKIYKLNNLGSLSIEDGHVHGCVKPLDLSITKNVLSLFMGSFLLLVLLYLTARFYKKEGSVAPKGMAKFLEPIIIMVRDDFAKSNIGERHYQKYVPYLLTIFFM